MTNPLYDLKDIKGYEGQYAASSDGHIWSHRRNIWLKPKVTKDGYHHVSLWDGENRRSFQVHRLVAEAFLPNPDNLPCINHKDENRTNNAVSNLEWCDHRYNANYGTRNAKLSKAIYCLETDTIYPSMKKASEELGMAIGLISCQLRKGIHVAKGYHICLAGDKDDFIKEWSTR